MEKKVTISFASYRLLSALSLFIIVSAYFESATAAHDSRPNIVIIYGDDVGFGDVGAYGATMIPTPNIDELANRGLRFTDGHSAAATCSPSRYSLLTGVHGFRDGVNILSPVAPLTISTEILTLPKLFQQAGYSTGVVGKWHLGIGKEGVETDWNGEVKPGPLEVGFDSSFILPSTNDRVPSVYLDGHHVANLDPKDPLYVGLKPSEVDRPGSTRYPNGKKNPEAMTYYKSTHGHNSSVINGIGRIGYMAGGKSALLDDETMADEFVNKAKAYIAANKDRPFFLYFSSQDIHVPRAPHPRFKGVSELSYRGDAMVQFDWSTGQIMAALEEHGLTDNTIVIFSSDNGPVYDDGYDDGTTVKRSDEEVDRGHDGSGIYRGGKYKIFEGGTRVPFIISWPAKVKPGVSSALVNQIDLMASFAELLDVDLTPEEARDSRNTLPAFLGEDPEGLAFMIEEAGRQRRALRSGNWKYIAGPEEALYDLGKDPGEATNIAAKFPEKTKELRVLLETLMNNSGIRKSGSVAKAAEGEWQTIFNGRDLTGWTAKIKGYPLGEDPKEIYRVEEGLLRVSYADYGSFDKDFGNLYYDRELSHYRLRFEYRFLDPKVQGGPKRNSGIMLHSQAPETMTLDQYFPVSIESQLLGGLGKGERPTGNVCTPGTHVEIDGELVTNHCTNSTSATFHGDQWVRFEVEVRGGDVIRHFVNGDKVFEFSNPVYDLRDERGKSLGLAEDSSLALTHGYITLQAEGGDLDFRNIELMELER